MEKKIHKLAVIRDNKDQKCPFGLSIPFACSSAGEAITKMAPLDVLGEDADESDKEKLAQANQKLLMMQGSGGRCAYAGKIFKEHNSVECNFGSNAPGVHNNDGLMGSPFYSKVYDNIAYDGLYSYPLGWYGDSNISRNLYYGAYSIQGSAETNIRKQASNSDIKDAAQHAVMQEDSSFTGKVCYKKAFEGEMSIKDILGWDDYSAWGQWQHNELKELDEQSLKQELDNFRGSSWAASALEWLRSGFPPIVLVYSAIGEVIGDGRGRVSLAVGLGLESLPVIVLNEDENGDICFIFEDGLIK